MQQMTFMECVKRAWSSAWQAAVQMPLLVAGTFVAYAALGWFGLAGRPVPAEGATPSAGLIALGNLASVLNSFIYLWFTLKISRFVLLGERATPLMPAGGKPFLRIFAVGLILAVALGAFALTLWFVLRPRYQGGAAFLVLVVVVIWMFVSVRLSLLFPALSIGSPIAFGAAWRDSRGHFWNLFGVTFVAALPVAVGGLLILIGMGLAGVSPQIVQKPGWLTALAIGQSVGNIVFALLTSAALAWLYRRYAETLPAPAAP
ncbi:hypothetical protein [Paraburkholderia lycopersici]|uniref:Uncharacterized protein n=1 Tax=Paraburkholderia lycopersici TaxID=416944 RepID=A0A1G6XK57_9BURK|nr:hypothetical protein [Paraburkholderia lycopersici]SDD78431.1 hypothetical protein SAMN05421548_12569 [Paraburkholderia lycopersici]